MEGDFAQLEKLIHREHETVLQLVDLLGQERTAITDRDLTALERVTQEKSLTLDAVEQATAARTAWAAQRGIDGTERSFHDFILASAERFQRAALREAWEGLRKDLQVAHRENLVNGRVISRSRQTLSHLLELLRGQVDAPKLYQRGGRAGSHGEGSEIARA